jgi:MFS family permease
LRHLQLDQDFRSPILAGLSPESDFFNSHGCYQQLPCVPLQSPAQSATWVGCTMAAWSNFRSRGATQIGILITAFFWTYTAGLAISGWIVDRFDVNWVLAAGFVLWSVATAATGFVQGFALLVAVRMLLGAGESVAFPSYGKIIALNVSQHHRGIANAMIIAGTALGPAVNPLTGSAVWQHSRFVEYRSELFIRQTGRSFQPFFKAMHVGMSVG